MATYRQHEKNEMKRRRRRALARFGVIGLLVAIILVLAYVIVLIVEGKPKVDPSSASGDVPGGSSEASNPNPNHNPFVGPVKQTINFEIITPDTRMIAIAQNGRVYMRYFETATFVGDSLTTGLDIYGIIPMAKFVAYKGVSPQSMMGDVKRADGVIVQPLDEIKVTWPQKVYIMLGCNCLSYMNDDQIINYYGQFIDAVRERTPSALIYIESILPVTAEKSTDARYSNDRIRALNDRIAKLSFEKGTFYVNVYEAFVNEGGSLKGDIAYGDGVHLTPQGYELWLEYLITHTVHRADNPYLPGSPLFKEPIPDPPADVPPEGEQPAA